MAEVRLKDINRIAVPAIIANISEPLITLGDTFILGKLDDPVIATSAVANATTFYLTIVWVLAQLKSAISALVAKAYGADRIKSVESLVPQTIFLAAGLGFAFYLITAPLAGNLFQFYSMTGETLEKAITYYQIRAIGFPFILVAFAIFGVFRGLQNTVWPMIISISGGLINLLLNYIMAIGIEDHITGMGIRGTAYASLIAQGYMCVFSVIILLKKTPFSLTWYKQANPRLKELIQIAGNLFIRTIVLNLTINLANRTATGISDAHNTAHNIAWQLWLFSAFFIDGYSNAANAIGGKLLGRNDFSTMRKMTLKVLKYNIGIACILGLIALPFYSDISLFFNPDINVNIYFNMIFWLTLIVLPVNAIAFSLDGLFKGLGDARFLRNVLIISTLGGFVPALFITQYFNTGLYGIWLSLIVWMVLRALLPYLKFIKITEAKIKA